MSHYEWCSEEEGEMVPAEAARSAIDRAEEAFQKCWDTLAVMKCGPIRDGFGELILAFQPTLAEALFRLDEFYRKLGYEKKAAIEKKAQIEPERFSTMMRDFEALRESVKAALEVGRSIGDAFAWFFYRKGQSTIGDHLQRPPIPHLPSGVGGQGELAFLSKIRHADCVAIYHGITTFLRIGDVSFLDLRSGEVIALGELKTQKVKDGEVVVTLHMMGTDRKRIPFSGVRVAPGAPPSDSPELRKDMADRLERQIGEMRDTLRTRQDDLPPGFPRDFFGVNNIYGGYHFGSLKRLAHALNTSDVAYEQVGGSLLLIGVNVPPGGSLSGRLFRVEEVDFKARLEKVVEHALKLVQLNSSDNRIRFGEISTRFLPGCAPPFWWPIDIRFLRSLYFQGLVVPTLYNPAHLLERFRDAGFAVNQSEDGSTYQIERLVAPNRRVLLEHLNWFFAAIQGHLMKEEKVIECVLAVAEKMQQGQVPPNTKVQMVINTEVFPKIGR
jgi:hypothetical protein